MNDIFHFVERPYNSKSDYKLKENEIIMFTQAQRAFLPMLPNCGIFYQTQKQILLFSGNSKQKLIIRHLTTVLVEYTRIYKIAEYIKFLSCTSFSDTFSGNQATCILFSCQRFKFHIFMFTYFNKLQRLSEFFCLFVLVLSVFVSFLFVFLLIWLYLVIKTSNTIVQC